MKNQDIFLISRKNLGIKKVKSVDYIFIFKICGSFCKCSKSFIFKLLQNICGCIYLSNLFKCVCEWRVREKEREESLNIFKVILIPVLYKVRAAVSFDPLCTHYLLVKYILCAIWYIYRAQYESMLSFFLIDLEHISRLQTDKKVNILSKHDLL